MKARFGVKINQSFSRCSVITMVRRIFLFTNYGVSQRAFPLPSPMEGVLMGGTVSSITRPQFGVAVPR
jgi:hypothetical protein